MVKWLLDYFKVEEWDACRLAMTHKATLYGFPVYVKPEYEQGELVSYELCPGYFATLWIMDTIALIHCLITWFWLNQEEFLIPVRNVERLRRLYE